MRTGPLFRAVAGATVLASCADGADVRLAELDRRVGEDAALAHGCADELRALAARDETAVGTALGLEARAGVLPPSPTAQRSVSTLAREEIVRGERAVDGSRSALTAARAVGPAALYEAMTADGIAREERRRLCRARDAALRLAGSGRSPPIAVERSAVRP